MPYCVLVSRIVSCCVEFLNLQLIRLSPSSHRRLNTAATPDLCISWLFVFPLNHNHLHLRQTSTYFSSIHILPGARWVDCSTPVWWLTCIYVDRVLCLHYLPCYFTPVGCALAISRPCLRWQIQDWPSPHSTLHSHTPQSQMGKRGFPEKSSSPAIFLFVIRGYIQIWHIIATWDWTFNIGIPLMFHFYFNIRGSFYTG